MSNISDAKNDPIGQIWDKLDKVHAVMLGSPDHRQHMQPMAPQTAREENAVWFYTKTTTDIARAAGGGGGHIHMSAIRSHSAENQTAISSKDADFTFPNREESLK